MNRLKTDLSDHLLFQRYGSGIKLIKPKYIQASSSLTLMDILSLPINVYFSNSDGVTEKCNEECAMLSGYDSANQAIGKSIYDTPDASIELAELCVKNNKTVMTSNKLLCVEENLFHADGFGSQALSIKLPWYDSEDKTIGIFGCSIVINQQPLAPALSTLMQLGLLKTTQEFDDNFIAQAGKQIGDVYFSRREVECLTHTSRGKSAREIGNILGLSRRTVEQYITSIKLKLKVRTKSELREKAMEFFV